MAPIVTEPLELEYLASIAKEAGFVCEIHDPFVNKQCIMEKIRRFRPGIMAVSGYYPARGNMFRLMTETKREFPEMVIIAGGVDIEVCFEDYYESCADILVYSGGFRTFRNLLENLWKDGLKNIHGICFRGADGGFIRNRAESMCLKDIPFPDRSHFHRHKSWYHYIGHGETALVKGSYGCPYSCSFCYARRLNQGGYCVRDMDDILDEVEGIRCNTIWLVDDIFLPDEKRAVEFIEKVRSRKLKKEFIIYSRADFICEHEILVPALGKAGVVNVIVGLEAVNDRELSVYRKGYLEGVNERCARILRKNGIGLTALFIAGLDADFIRFFKLFKWIVKHRIKTYTVSVFTPLPGTDDFEAYKARLTTADPSKWDFMHLVVKPEKTSVLHFYIYLWGLYVFQSLFNIRQSVSQVRYWLKRKLQVNNHAD